MPQLFPPGSNTLARVCLAGAAMLLGCTGCHGRVDQMPLTAKGAALQMRWCLECHRAPQEYVRPKDAVFEPRFDLAERPQSGSELLRINQVVTERLQDCSTCHR